MTKTERPQPHRKALGRGLGALIPGRSSTETPEAEPAAIPAEGVAKIPIRSIEPNPYQPRQGFDEEKLEELAQSIRINGLIQPVVVRREGDRYILVVGERRWRAAQIAGLRKIPAILQDIPQERLLEVTLIENIQREDLNPIETALAMERMSRELGLSHEEIANRTGKDRATVTNLIRILKLPAEVQTLLGDGSLSMGHARAILSLPSDVDQIAVAEQAVSQRLSVRSVERIVQRRLEFGGGTVVAAEERLDPNVAAAIREMEQTLGTRVRIVQRSRKTGRIEIEYYSADDLQRIYSIIVGDQKESE